MHDPIAYTFEADTHCPACTIARFGQDPGHYWPPEDATDSEGNTVGAVFPWDEWCEPEESGRAVLACGTCRGIIEEHYHSGTLCVDRETFDELEPEYVSRCPACGDPIDYCQGHGEIGDPAGRAILDAHDDGDHSDCHPVGCGEVTCGVCGDSAGRCTFERACSCWYGRSCVEA